MIVITLIYKLKSRIEKCSQAPARAILFVLIAHLSSAVPGQARGNSSLEIKVLSSRADMVSGGDALLQIVGMSDGPKTSIWADGKNVTTAFRTSQQSHSLIGLVGGLAVGENSVEVKSGGKVKARLKIVNHEITGPVFSGPHQTPFVCETASAGLGEPLDADCSIATKVTYIYKSTQPHAPPQPKGTPAGFKVYNPQAPPPTDIAEITTTQGKKVRYIVRLEEGTINRALYEIAFLHEPGTPLPDSWTFTPGWNGRLVYDFGGGCGAGFHQGHAVGGVDNIFLALGYAEVTSSLNVLGNNCNDVLSAETAAMVKEHFIKSFGAPVHTIGWGGSGGSIQQYLIAQNYPGLLDGIIPSMSFPDIATILPGIVDCTLLADFFKNSTQTWTDEQRTAVSGFATWGTCASNIDSWMKWFSPQLVSATSCNPVISAAQAYNPNTNRSGVRCDFYDNEVNIFGVDPKTGFARRALDNVGVQYGLAAFNNGIIGAEQFLEFNEKIGGFDADGKVVSGRMAADPEALRIAYASGRVNLAGGGLGSIPIIDIRTYGDLLPDIHDEYRSFVLRARLIAADGNADNQVILTFPYAAKPGKNLVTPFAAVTATLVPKMDQWLDAIDKDDSKRSVLEKIAAARPADLTDACWTTEGEKIAEQRVFEGSSRCNQLYPPHGDSRIVAGSSVKEDVLKCTLKAIDPNDYLHPFSAEQLTRLKGIFPLGVCNYSVPGVGQGPLKRTWECY